MLSRRTFIGSMISLVAAPAIVRVSSIMPVKAMEPVALNGWEWTVTPKGTFIYTWTGPMEELLLRRTSEAYRLMDEHLKHVYFGDGYG